MLTRLFVVAALVVATVALASSASMSSSSSLSSSLADAADADAFVDDADDVAFEQALDSLDAGDEPDDEFDELSSSFVDENDAPVDGDDEFRQLGTGRLRRVWSAHCRSLKRKTITLWNGAKVTISSRAVEAFEALDKVMKKFKYNLIQSQTGAYNCRRITGGRGYSLHAYGTAVDYNWNKNPYSRTLITDMPTPMVAAIKAIKTKNGKKVFKWGGDFRPKRDAMHFEIGLAPKDMATGIDPNSLPKEKKKYRDLAKWHKL